MNSDSILAALVVFLGCIAVVLVAMRLVARRWLSGPDLAAFDLPAPASPAPASPAPASPAPASPAPAALVNGAVPGDALRAVVAKLSAATAALSSVPASRRIAAIREGLETLFAGETETDARIVPVDAGGVPAEWVLAPGADPDRRLLYIHGGAFVAGSPRSHRRLTTRFSEVANAAVLAIDYRLMPEHPRMAGIDDCRSAYRWMLGHGPEDEGPPATAYVAGDSAGGNLALSLIAWLRDHGMRAPDAVVALSPGTDGTLSSPSLRGNLDTDPMLGPVFRPLMRIPHWVLLWAMWLQARVNPRDPVVSPVFGDLSGLPPVLVLASESEMLRDDARRYANRAAAAGSPVELRTWAHMVHVWPIFHRELPEGREAFEAIRDFLARH